MTRKDYVLLAAAFNRVKPVGTRERGCWNNCIAEVAEALKEENPRFDKERFFKACING